MTHPFRHSTAGLAAFALFLAPLMASAYSEAAYYGQPGYYGQGVYYTQSSYTGGSGGATHVSYRIFTYTGSAQTFTVPSDVTSLRVVIVGGGGGGGGGAANWGSGGGGGCGGAVRSGTISVTPGQVFSVSVGAGGAGGANHAQNGSSGVATTFGSYSAAGGGWGRAGYYNLLNNYQGGTGGGSGSGGGGNGYPYAYSAVPGQGGTNGNQTNSYGAGGYCIGAGWRSL